eukprot:2969907-Prymnesium_polylepis.1
MNSSRSRTDESNRPASRPRRASSAGSPARPSASRPASSRASTVLASRHFGGPLRRDHLRLRHRSASRRTRKSAARAGRGAAARAAPKGLVNKYITVHSRSCYGLLGRGGITWKGLAGLRRLAAD